MEEIIGGVKSIDFCTTIKSIYDELKPSDRKNVMPISLYVKHP